MRFDVKTDDFNMVANGIGDDAARAVTGAMDEIAGGLKDDLRGQVTQAGLGARLANTWQARRYPAARASVDAAAYVWSKAPKLITAFDKGVTIRSSRGVFLAIPTPAAGLRGLGRERVTPGGWERRTGLRLRFVYRRLGPSLLVADDAQSGKSGLARSAVRRRGGAEYLRVEGRQTIVIFILVPQVTLRKRLDVDGAANRWASRVDDIVAEHWQ